MVVIIWNSGSQFGGRSEWLQINRTGKQKKILNTDFVFFIRAFRFWIAGYIYILKTRQSLVKLATAQWHLQPMIMGHCCSPLYIQSRHVHRYNPVKSIQVHCVFNRALIELIHNSKLISSHLKNKMEIIIYISCARRPSSLLLTARMQPGTRYPWPTFSKAKPTLSPPRPKTVWASACQGESGSIPVLLWWVS